jgi:hypothetical protein
MKEALPKMLREFHLNKIEDKDYDVVGSRNCDPPLSACY